MPETVRHQPVQKAHSSVFNGYYQYFLGSQFAFAQIKTPAEAGVGYHQVRFSQPGPEKR